MKYELHLTITSSDSGCRCLKSSVDLPIPPSTNHEFSYPLWNSTKKPDSVTFALDYGDDQPELQTVILTFLELLAEGMSLADHVQLYFDQGWQE